MQRPLLLSYLGCLLFAVYTGQINAAPTTEIMPLKHGTAAAILPALQPLLQEDERASAYGNQLLIRAEPERLQDIRSLLAELDRRPAQLRISVANAGTTSDSQTGYRVDGRITTDAGDLAIGQPRAGNQARIIRRETAGANDGVRVLVASEGHPVMIQTGQSIPLTSSSGSIHGQILQQTRYHDVTAGFYAVVHLDGDHASIQLSANDDRLSPQGHKVLEVQRTDTQVTVPLGQWVTIGGVDQLDNSRQQGLARQISTRRTQQQSIRLKVERLD